jgi:transcriptional regulator with XRE-family HTH domain
MAAAGIRWLSMMASRIGTALKAARVRRGWSRETLAHHSGVSWSAIAQIESGRREDVRSSTLAALARALDVSVDYLIGSANATAPRLLEHRLLTYGSDEEYLAAAIPLLSEGIERSESLLAVTTGEQRELLRDSLGNRAGRVEFGDSAEWYRSPGTAMDGYRTFVNQKLEEGATWIRIFAEISPERRSDAEISAWARYESFVNLAFASAPTTFVCSYDDTSWPEDMITGARRTHPEVTDGTAATVNREYRGPEDLLLDH